MITLTDNEKIAAFAGWSYRISSPRTIENSTCRLIEWLNPHGELDVMPDYFCDRDAIADAVALLTVEQRRAYLDNLGAEVATIDCTELEFDWLTVNAGPAPRAKAILGTIKRWEAQ